MAEARAERLKLLSQIDDYLLPRLRQSGAPILVALVGSTGAGKSTLMNSLVGMQVSQTGIRRPTTNSPVLACHPADAHWFAENVFLPTLPRVRQQGWPCRAATACWCWRRARACRAGVALLDTPDIDSVVQAHRDFAHQFLDASDLWLFMTSARRYADAAVWETAAGRPRSRRRAGDGAVAGAAVVRPRSSSRTSTPCSRPTGCSDVQRFVIPETIVTDAHAADRDGRGPVRDWLTDTARRDDRRVAVLTQTMSGVLDTFRDRIPALAAQAADPAQRLRGELPRRSTRAYARGLAELRRGHQERLAAAAARYSPAGRTSPGPATCCGPSSPAAAAAARLKKDRSPGRADALRAALHASLQSLIISTADRAAEQSADSWQRSWPGTALLAAATPGAKKAADGTAVSETEFVASALADLGVADASAESDPAALASLSRATAGLAARAARAISGWQEYVHQLVREENVTRRSIARVVSFDEESLGLVLAIAVLGYGTADVTVTEGASAAPQRVLTSLFGAGLLRDIGARVRLDLHERVGGLFDAESRRFTVIVDGAGSLDETVAAELQQAGYLLESAR